MPTNACASCEGSAAWAGQAGGGDQFAVLVADQQVVGALGDREVQRGGDVLVGVAVGHRDGAAQQPQLVVGADEADELDPAGRRPTGGDLVDAQRIAARRGRGLVGRAPVGRLVAVLAVVEGLERAVAPRLSAG